MRAAYQWIARLIAVGVVLQAAAIALAWFTVIGDLDDGKTLTEDWEYNIGHIVHAVVGTMVMPLLGLALFILSLFAKFPGGVKWAGLTFLAIVIQVLLAFVSFAAPVTGVLHGIVAFVVFDLAINAVRRARPADGTADQVRPGAPAPV